MNITAKNPLAGQRRMVICQHVAQNGFDLTKDYVLDIGAPGVPDATFMDVAMCAACWLQCDGEAKLWIERCMHGSLSCSYEAALAKGVPLEAIADALVDPRAVGITEAEYRRKTERPDSFMN